METKTTTKRTVASSWRATQQPITEFVQKLLTPEDVEKFDPERLVTIMPTTTGVAYFQSNEGATGEALEPTHVEKPWPAEAERHAVLGTISTLLPSVGFGPAKENNLITNAIDLLMWAIFLQVGPVSGKMFETPEMKPEFGVLAARPFDQESFRNIRRFVMMMHDTIKFRVVLGEIASGSFKIQVIRAIAGAGAGLIQSDAGFGTTILNLKFMRVQSTLEDVANAASGAIRFAGNKKKADTSTAKADKTRTKSALKTALIARLNGEFGAAFEKEFIGFGTVDRAVANGLPTHDYTAESIARSKQLVENVYDILALIGTDENVSDIKEHVNKSLKLLGLTMKPEVLDVQHEQYLARMADVEGDE